MLFKFFWRKNFFLSKFQKQEFNPLWIKLQLADITSINRDSMRTGQCHRHNSITHFVINVPLTYHGSRLSLKKSTSKKQWYRKISIDRPGGIHFLSTHNFWIIHKRPKIKTYSERMEIFLSEYAFIFVLWQVVQKLCVDKKWIPPGLSIEILR